MTATRSRATAKQAGTTFERLIADYLKQHVDDRIDRRVKTGARDKGDIAGLRAHGQRVTLELKNSARLDIGPWLKEAEVERGNDDALAGIVVYKRTKYGKSADQIVTMTLADFVALVTGVRPDSDG